MLAKPNGFYLLLALLFLATRCASPIQPTPTLTPILDVPTPTRTLNPTRTPAPVTPIPTPANLARIDQDVDYCNVNHTALKMDLYFPKSVDQKPFAVAVNIHGGSWSMGDKDKSDSAPDIPMLVERGYVVAAINYRLASQDKFPAQIIDAKCAIRFLRANAVTYHLDPNRIAAWGCSAGGQLAALLGVTDPSAGFDQGQYLDQSSRVQAVATLTAPFDINLYDPITRAEMLNRVFGTSTDKNILAQASPIMYASKRAAPFLIFQGDQDTLISPVHGENFVKRLTDAGGKVKLITVNNGHHCFPSEPSPSPSRAEISSMIADFFDKEMRR